MNVLHGWLLPIALSLLAFLGCLAIPRFRHYSLRALVVPMAFSSSRLGAVSLLLSASTNFICLYQGSIGAQPLFV
jgi:hypothetical protein